MSKSRVISFAKEFNKLRFVANRTPESTDKQLAGAYAELAHYGNGAIFIGHYAGNSEWERHSHGDEFVYALEGETTLTLLTEKGESQYKLTSGEFLIVPQDTWHRFETPEGVKIMTATPQPTDHSIQYPLA
ncbi:MAG: cupin domain-containing protein [Pseudomonadota bacterium]